MEKLGTTYGGWILPKDIPLNENSIVYSAGVGEDISFDLALSHKYKCHIYLIDPTLRAKTHFAEVQAFYENNTSFTGNIQKDYYEQIHSLNPDLSKFLFIDMGLWDKSDTLKFYKQQNTNYVSQSLIVGMFTDKYDLVRVNSIKNLMSELRHTHIDLIKLDIEGAEIVVLEQMFQDNIFPTYICVEFDLLIKKKDFLGATQKLINTMITEHNYVILANDKSNITFQRTPSESHQT